MNGPSALRREWLDQTVNAFQSFGDAGLLDELDQLALRVSQALTSVPIPQSACEFLIAESLAFRFGRSLLVALHRRVGVDDCACIPSLVDSLTRAPKNGGDWWRWLDRWSREAIEAVQQYHPVGMADHAAATIRRSPQTQWDTGRLATNWHRRCSRRALVRAFRTRYRMNVREYVQICRVAAAVPNIRCGGKVVSVVGESGFRSTRDFYEAFDHFVGLKPARVRSIDADIAQALESRLRQWLIIGR